MDNKKGLKFKMLKRKDPLKTYLQHRLVFKSRFGFSSVSGGGLKAFNWRIILL